MNAKKKVRRHQVDGGETAEVSGDRIFVRWTADEGRFLGRRISKGSAKREGGGTFFHQEPSKAPVPIRVPWSYSKRRGVTVTS